MRYGRNAGCDTPLQNQNRAFITPAALELRSATDSISDKFADTEGTLGHPSEKAVLTQTGPSANIWRPGLH